MNHQLILKNNQFLLHPSGAIYWEEQAMLLVADVHFGKVSHFRKHGAAIPPAVSEENFSNIDQVLQQFKPKTLCFLGDLFHSTLNEEWTRFSNWMDDLDCKVSLVIGNHDIIPLYLFEELNIEVVPELRIEVFLLTHHPTKREGFFNFAGHIHPGVRLTGMGKQGLRIPCFFQSEGQLILPAFGTFTGKHILEPTQKDKVYAIADGEVICLT